jgi:hypothetical protein
MSKERMTPLAGQSNSPFPKPIKKVILSLHPTSQTSPVPPTPSSPAPPTYPIDPIALDILTRELPHVGDGQVPLSEVLSRVVQDTYARFVELVDMCVLSLSLQCHISRLNNFHLHQSTKRPKRKKESYRTMDCRFTKTNSQNLLSLQMGFVGSRRCSKVNEHHSVLDQP